MSVPRFVQCGSPCAWQTDSAQQLYGETMPHRVLRRWGTSGAAGFRGAFGPCLMPAACGGLGLAAGTSCASLGSSSSRSRAL
jgi:hypothetical protein